MMNLKIENRMMFRLREEVTHIRSNWQIYFGAIGQRSRSLEWKNGKGAYRVGHWSRAYWFTTDGLTVAGSR